MRGLFIGLRIVGAAAVAAAIVGQYLTSWAFWVENEIDDRFSTTVNFFSFFTIESNILSVAVFAIGAVLLIRSAGPEPTGFSVFRASVTAYMVTTGIVYNMLLRGIELPQGTTLAWSNEILHVAAPILIALDWLFAPGRRRLEWRHIGVIVIFPIAWALYTMIRGPFAADPVFGGDGWYPYPFLNPAISDQGYVSVAFYVILIAAIIGGVGAGIIRISRAGERWPLPGSKT